ncbi:hypothetical protein GFL58_30640 [Rhizobium leguminosarum bv. viciae]|uniref:hypothetical protein n=1 Tax=Rhizobium TaxID=379 RepID=UPI0010316979|nr:MULTISPECIES: hypothetical protein [Rhizobium]NKM65277.1 hypothetical protein [Rhizobium leguminosarum bv. viciae]TAV04497.1 hypothetical protein ELI39_03930 [Rhizobium ruizarguesonis]
MPEPKITKLIKAAMPAIKNMGRTEIAKAHAMGLPGVYMIGKKIVREFPDGRIEEVHRDT